MLPSSRNQTYISGVTPVAANDMNDLQDQVIAINKLVTGQPQANWTNVAFAGNLTVGGQLYAFNDFTFTADSATDQLAATGHPLQTGDGPLRNTNSGGSPPGNLPLATDWYAIYVDANHVKAATTRANALAGIFIDISSNGSGTQTVAHQAGTTRVSDETVTRNLTVDGNAAVSGTLTYGNPIVIPASAGRPVAGSGATLNIGGGKYDAANAGDVVAFPVVLPIGQKIASIDVWYQRAGGTLTFDLKKQVLSSGAISSLGSTTVNSGTSIAPATIAAINYTTLVGEQYWLMWTAGATADSLRAVVVH